MSVHSMVVVGQPTQNLCPHFANRLDCQYGRLGLTRQQLRSATCPGKAHPCSSTTMYDTMRLENLCCTRMLSCPHHQHTVTTPQPSAPSTCSGPLLPVQDVMGVRLPEMSRNWKMGIGRKLIGTSVCIRPRECTRAANPFQVTPRWIRNYPGRAQEK